MLGAQEQRRLSPVLFTLLAWLFALAALLRRFTSLRSLGNLLGRRFRPCAGYPRAEMKPQAFPHSPPKPPWVRKEILRLKALMPLAGCRAIGDGFNRRFLPGKRMSVGETFVSELLRKHRYEIEVLRRQIKNAHPKPVPQNLVWALDLTGKTSLDEKSQVVLGILEHASRAALWLEALDTKSSWLLVSKLVSAIRRYGKPRLVRTDNEAVFTSKVFRLALLLLGIRHHRTDPGCPWQNGRIERSSAPSNKVSTTSPSIHPKRSMPLSDNFASSTTTFDLTSTSPAARLPKPGRVRTHSFARQFREYWFEAWDGLVTGYYLRR